MDMQPASSVQARISLSVINGGPMSIVGVVGPRASMRAPGFGLADMHALGWVFTVDVLATAQSIIHATVTDARQQCPVGHRDTQGSQRRQRHSKARLNF